MTAQVVFLNSWLNCPDDQLRFHFRIQTRLNEEKAKFWFDINGLNIDIYQKVLCYDRWVHSNRDRLKVITGDNLEETNCIWQF
jgi:hypothetical protein